MSMSRVENQQQTQPTYDARVRESNLGHIGGRRGLSPLRQPCPQTVMMSCLGCFHRPMHLVVMLLFC